MKTRAFVILLSLFVLLVACGGASAPTHTPSDVIAAFNAAGLEAENPEAMKPDDYGMAPLLGDGIRFLVPSLCVDCGGRVLAFKNQEDLESMKTYYETLAKDSAMFFSWVYVKDNILVQINGELDEATAQKYEAALNGLE